MVGGVLTSGTSRGVMMAWALGMNILSPTCKTKTKHRGTLLGSATRLGS